MAFFFGEGTQGHWLPAGNLPFQNSDGLLPFFFLSRSRQPARIFVHGARMAYLFSCWVNKRQSGCLPVGGGNDLDAKMDSCHKPAGITEGEEDGFPLKT